MKQTIAWRTLHWRRVLLVAALLAAAVVYRVALSHLTFKTIIFDMNEFTVSAEKFLKGEWVVDCCDRTLGYSFFLAGIYRVFGVENVSAVLGTQIVLDLLSAGCIALVAGRVGGRAVAWIAFVLALFNPFTASYAGLLLSEPLAVFLVVVLAVIASQPYFRKNPGWWFALGLTAGLLVFVKMAYYYFAFTFPLALMVLVFRRWIRGVFLAVVFSGLVLGSSYTLARNLTGFYVISMVPPYNMSYGALYLNFYHGPPSELAVQFRKNPPYEAVYWEYYATPYAELRLFQEKYKRIFWEKMKTDWPVFFTIVGKNIWWIWDKEHLGAVYDDFYPADKWPLRLTNMTLLVLFLIGLTRYIRQEPMTRFREPLVIMTIILFLHMTALFPLVSNESRHTLPFYGIICIWAAYGSCCISRTLFTMMKSA